MKEQNNLSARLNAALAKTGWSQSELARRAGGMRRDAISTYCMGKTIPGDESLERIATALGGSPADLMKGKLPTPAILETCPPPQDRPKSASSPVELHQNLDGSLLLRLAKVVTIDQAQRILTILSEPH